MGLDYLGLPYKPEASPLRPAPAPAQGQAPALHYAPGPSSVVPMEYGIGKWNTKGRGRKAYSNKGNELKCGYGIGIWNMDGKESNSAHTRMKYIRMELGICNQNGRILAVPIPFPK